MSQEISRKDFLKQLACLAACPLFINSVATSCGETGLGGEDKPGEEGLVNSGEGNLQEITSSQYENMSSGSFQLITLKDEQEILLFKVSNSEYKAFQPKCPHAGGRVTPEPESGETAVCQLHGALFNKEGKALTDPAKSVENPFLKSFKVTVGENTLTVDVLKT